MSSRHLPLRRAVDPGSARVAPVSLAACAACAACAALAAACGTGSPARPSPSAADARAPGSGADATVDARSDTPALNDAALDYPVTAYDGVAAEAGPARIPVHAEIVSNRAQVAQMLFAGGEMQISGEPFASGFAGRNLGDYDRDWLPPNQYILNLGTVNVDPVTDLFGFSTAVESYEYSKYYMNMVVEESTAGISLANGPVVATLAAESAFAKLQARMADLLTSAGTAASGYATVPAPVNVPANTLGWPGLWPAFAPFADFDPTMDASSQITTGCVYSGGYASLSVGSTSPIYECNYNSTHLVNAVAQVNRTLTPATFGYAAWKEAIWAIDFAGRIHDLSGNQVSTVASADLPRIGTLGNTVTATSPDGAATGTYIGSSPVEGMWGLTMLANMDNAAELLRSGLLTVDGVTLSGLSGAAAMAYDYSSPLAWFPAAVAVTEDDTVQPYPPVTGLAITDATSTSEGLAALLLGHSMFFGMTDPRNAGVGQRLGLQATFDGDPFPSNIGNLSNPSGALGQATAHDRALGVIRLAFVDLDRMHADPTLGVLVDSASVAVTGSGGAAHAVVTRSASVTTRSLAHVLIGLRQTLLSVNGAITQYGAANPDPNADVNCIFEQDGLEVHPSYNLDAGPSVSFSERVRAVFTTNANVLLNQLTQPDGSVVNGGTIAGGVLTPLTTAATLESQTSALRALIEAFLLTGDSAYEIRAQAVARQLIGPSFYSATARMFRGVEGGADEVDMTPELFGFLQSSLRETYKSLFVPGDPALDRTVLEDRIARVNKLFLNGWDDLNGNQGLSVDGGDYPSECLLQSDAGVSGGLQQAEQALTGETGINLDGQHVRDRDSDCVPELAHAGKASVMAAQIHFHSP